MKIRVITASAGAGKTTAIVSAIANEVVAREPESIVATTFTVIAAGELIERSRARLFEEGRADAASRLLGARFGTVNGVCGQIVADHAIALGRSPRVEVVSEGVAARVFAIAADAAIGRHAPELNRLSERFGALEPKRGSDIEAADWRRDVRRIISLGRANGIDAAGLAASADRSVASLLELLPPPGATTAEAFDAALNAAVHAALRAVPPVLSATARPHVELLRRMAPALRRGEPLNWTDWARLSKVVCAKKDGPKLVSALGDVAAAAAAHAGHPRLREDCERFIRGIFECAAQSQEAYQRHKAERGLLDFIDQEALALEVLRDPGQAEVLRERISCVFVDEFQDSSPLQIAIFARLAELVEESTWVGDQKQAIYGFRSADSDLAMAAFAGAMALSDAPAEILARSYRSRAGITDFCNAAFGPAFDRMGLDPSDHAFSGTARTEDGFERPALGVWWLDGKLELQYAAMAGRIRDMIDRPSDWPVKDRSGGVRPLCPGDVAVLCRTGDDVVKAAEALAAAGVKVAVEREGLSRTLHVGLVLAAVRWVADASDLLSLAELSRFLADDPGSDDWIRAAASEDRRQALRDAVHVAPALEGIRTEMLSLTAAEVLDAVISVPGIIRRLEGWGDHDVRLEDLEALRGGARAFEESCAASGSPATVSGLLLALSADEPSRPASLSANAVKVMTYHGAKGLEWPLVVMAGLAKESRARLFEPVAEFDGELDWRDPLRGRWIRYWPWPYGAQSKDVRLDETAAASPLGAAALVKARGEDTRLLYVGMTRARDYLVLGAQAKGPLKWLQVLDGEGGAHLVLPAEGGTPLVAGLEQFEATVERPVIKEEAATTKRRATFVQIPRTSAPRPPLVRRPSWEAADGAYRIVERVDLGGRLPMVGRPDMRLLGEAVHAVFAADDLGASFDSRMAAAERVFGNWNATGLSPSCALHACDRLHAHIRENWNGAKIRREVAVIAKVGGQLVSGRIDLLLTDAEGAIVIDHKSFPGARDTWAERAANYGPQLGLYAQAVCAATKVPCDRLYVHMPLIGTLLRVARS